MVTNHTSLAKPKSKTETLAVNGVSSYGPQYHSAGTWIMRLEYRRVGKNTPAIYYSVLCTTLAS